jgi:hypothetical protein
MPLSEILVVFGLGVAAGLGAALVFKLLSADDSSGGSRTAPPSPLREPEPPRDGGRGADPDSHRDD